MRERGAEKEGIVTASFVLCGHLFDTQLINRVRRRSDGVEGVCSVALQAIGEPFNARAHLRREFSGARLLHGMRRNNALASQHSHCNVRGFRGCRV